MKWLSKLWFVQKPIWQILQEISNKIFNLKVSSQNLHTCIWIVWTSFSCNTRFSLRLKDVVLKSNASSVFFFAKATFVFLKLLVNSSDMDHKVCFTDFFVTQFVHCISYLEVKCFWQISHSTFLTLSWMCLMWLFTCCLVVNCFSKATVEISYIIVYALYVKT